MTKYILPNFIDLKPRYISSSIKEVKRSYLYDGNYEYQNKNIKKNLQIALAKIENKEILNRRDLKALSYNLLLLEQINRFDDFFKAFVTKINEIRNKTYFVRPFLSYIYNGKNDKYKHSIFNILKVFMRLNIKHRERYNDIFAIVRGNNSLDSFIVGIEDQFINIKNQNEIEDVCNSLFIRSTDKIYNNLIMFFIYNNYLDEQLWSFHKSKIDLLSLELKKRLFKKILLRYKNNFNVKTYPEKWFNLIRTELGDPFDPVNQRWRGLEEEKEIYRRWNVSENIDEYFDKIVGGDRRRKVFWRKYIDNIYRIEYIEEAAKALVMEFERHLFVEFAQTGNAMYYYNKDTFNINDIRERLKNTKMSRSKKTKYLKQKALAVNSLTHHKGNWESKFDYEIGRLGYTRSR